MEKYKLLKVIIMINSDNFIIINQKFLLNHLNSEQLMTTLTDI